MADSAAARSGRHGGAGADDGVEGLPDEAAKPEGSGLGAGVQPPLGQDDALMFRLLKPEEWNLLKGLAENDDWIPHPGSSAVIVAQDNDDKIVGFLVAQLAVHVEPLWVAPSGRGGMTMVRLWHEMQGHLREQGIKIFFSHASTEEIGAYLERLGLERLT